MIAASAKFKRSLTSRQAADFEKALQLKQSATLLIYANWVLPNLSKTSYEQRVQRYIALSLRVSALKYPKSASTVTCGTYSCGHWGTGTRIPHLERGCG